MNKVSIDTIKQGYKKGFKTIKNSKMFLIKSLFVLLAVFLGNITFYFSGMISNFKHDITSNSLNKSEFDVIRFFNVIEEKKRNRNLRAVTFIKAVTMLTGLLVTTMLIFILNITGVLIDGFYVLNYGFIEVLIVGFLIIGILMFILLINSYFNYVEYIIINNEIVESNVIVNYFKNTKFKELLGMTIAKFLNYIIPIITLSILLTMKDSGYVNIIDEIIPFIKIILILVVIVTFVIAWFINLNISGVCFKKLQMKEIKGEYFVDALNKEEQHALINLFERNQGDS